MSVNTVLDMVKRGEEISVSTIIANVKWPVEREEFERYLTERGWFYAIKTDSFMPPEWVDQQRRDACNYGVGIVRTDADGNTRIAPEDFFT